MPNPQVSRQAKVAAGQDSLSQSTLRRICLEHLDKVVYNELPQYLIRISDMRLCSRDELWEDFRPLVDTIPIDNVEGARNAMGNYDHVWFSCKKIIKRLLRFAILSHRWGSREPAFRDISNKIYGTKARPVGLGYEKLLRFCEKAKEYGCKYVWSDTCCINKESSAELEEAIRSMYRWYEDAFVCIVYLAKSSSVDDFQEEPWFTRGWTLQELLAPMNLRMYGKDWSPICPQEENTSTLSREHRSPDPDHSPSNHFPNDKQSSHMLDAISKVTGIDAVYVRWFRSKDVSLSEKMRWASKRKTTRVEDIAYSLLGIFDISMSIAYGEGKMAFRRLLDAIAQHSQDPTFFAWAGQCSNYSLALPSSPSSFGTRVSTPGGGDRGYTIQKLGVQVKLLLIEMQVRHLDRHYTLHPLDASLSQIITVTDQLQRRPNVFSGESCALGVVNFDRQSLGSDNEDDNGFLFAGKRYFCILIKPSPASIPSTFGQPSLKLETGDILPTMKCKKDYGARPTSVCLIHTL